MKKKLVIVGAGGLGREILWQITEDGYQLEMYDILGFIDDTIELQGENINGYPVLGNIEWLLNYSEEISVVICIGNSNDRRKIIEIISSNKNILFPTIISGAAHYSSSVKFGKGCIVCISTIFTVNIEVGDFVITNLDCTVGHDVVLEDYVTIYPSVNVSGNVHIGTCTEIGTGTNIIQKKNIGNYCIIGAGSVVVKDIPNKCTAVGAPAKPIKYHR